MLPRSAWRLLKFWYSGGPKISRRVFAFGSAERQHLRIALFPSPIDVHTCGSDGRPDQLTKVVPFPTGISIAELKETLATMCYSAPLRVRALAVVRVDLRHADTRHRFACGCSATTTGS